MSNWLNHADTSTVLWGQMIIYTVYCLFIISLVAWLATRLKKTESRLNFSPKLFYGWLIFLVALGVSLHLLTLNTIPWVKADLFGGNVTQYYPITVANHQWTFMSPTATKPQPGAMGTPLSGDLSPTSGKAPLQVACNALVEFDVQSPLAPKGAPEPGLTYGFGVFQQITRPDGTIVQGPMVAQMQVVPGNYTNDLRWAFVRNGTYMIRSTEYSGPAQLDGQTDKLMVPNAIQVTGC